MDHPLCIVLDKEMSFWLCHLVHVHTLRRQAHSRIHPGRVHLLFCSIFYCDFDFERPQDLLVVLDLCDRFFWDFLWPLFWYLLRRRGLVFAITAADNHPLVLVCILLVFQSCRPVSVSAFSRQIILWKFQHGFTGSRSIQQ